MNIKLLARVKKRILAEPRQFQMSVWYATRSDVPNCGTAACICGWAVALNQKQSPFTIAHRIDRYDGSVNFFHNAQMLDRGMKALGLNEEQAERLFLEKKWPYKFQSGANTGSKEYAENAIARINHFIVTNGRE